MNGEQQFKEKSFVEDVGLVFEQLSLPRMAGRILGCLMLSNPPHQSIEELAEALMASKGSISTMTRLLIQFGILERVSLPGVRHDYFHIRPDALQHLIEQRAGQITALRKLAERGLELVGDKSPVVRQGFEEMRDMYAFFEREFPALLERWEQEWEKRQAQFVKEGGSK